MKTKPNFNSLCVALSIFATITCVQAGSPGDVLTVLEGQLVVCKENGEDSSFSVDLPQDWDLMTWWQGSSRRERILSIYTSDSRNSNQDFVFIPTSGNAWFVCAKKSGAVIGVRNKEPAGKKTEIVGILDQKEDLKAASIRWVMEDCDIPDRFVLRSKEIDEYLTVEDGTLEDTTDFVFTQSKQKATKFHLERNGESREYSLQSFERNNPPDPPNPTSTNISTYPRRTDEMCVSEKLVPYFAVNDPKFPSWESRIQGHPIYRIRVSEWWERKSCEVWDGSRTKKVVILAAEEKVRSIVQREIIEKVSQKSAVNLPVNITVGFHFDPLSPRLPHQALGVTVGDKLSWESEIEKHRQETHNKAQERVKNETAVTVTFPANGVESLYATWFKHIRVDCERIDSKGSSTPSDPIEEAIDFTTQKSLSFPGSKK